jgi:hypothetical protein
MAGEISSLLISRVTLPVLYFMTNDVGPSQGHPALSEEMERVHEVTT